MNKINKNKMKSVLTVAVLVLAVLVASRASATRTTNTLIADRENHRVIEVNPAGTIVWQYGQTGVYGSGTNQLYHPNDAERLANGNTLIADHSNNRVIEVTPAGSIVWQYGQPGVRDSETQLLSFPSKAERLDNGNTLIVDGVIHRVIEVDAGRNIVWQYGQSGVFGSGPNQLNYPTDAERLANGNTLIADLVNRRVIEVDAARNIVWQYGQTGVLGSGPNQLNHPNDVERLANGNTLIADTYIHRVIEVQKPEVGTAGGTIVWQYGETGVAGSGPNQLNQPKDAERLTNGNTLIADGLNGRVIEVDAAKNIVWQKTELNWPYDSEEILNPNAVYNTAYMYYQNLEGVWMAYAAGWVVTYIEYVPVGTPSIILTKTVSPEGTQASGAELTYTITYNNTGNGTATNCVLYDQIPENTEYIAGSAQVVSGDTATLYYSIDGGSSWTTTEPSPATSTTNIKWVFGENVISPGETGSVRFRVRIR